MTNSLTRLAGAGGAYVFATVAPILVLLAVTPVVTRVLGAEQYGEVAVAISVYQFSSVLLAVGLPVVITRTALTGSGFAHASGLVVAGSLFGFGLAILGSISAVAWAPLFFPGVDVSIVAAAVFGGFGLAVVTLAQAVLRAAERVGRFVAFGIGSALLGPTIGVLLLFVVGADAQLYVLGLASGYVVAAIAAIISTVSLYRPRTPAREFWAGLRIGLPTVPHALAVPLLLTIGLAIVVRAEGLEVAGQLQIAALLGSSLVTVMNAINNAWVPLVFKASDPGRPRLLADSTFVVALAALVMICAYVVIAPLLVRFVAGVPLVDELVVCTSIVIATGVVFHVVYLANIHLTFLSGRTAPLALLTPLSAVIALLPLAFGGSISTGLVPIAFGLVWPIFYALQAVFSSLLAGRSGYPRVHFGWASIPLTLALVLALSVVLLSPNPAVVLAWTGIVLSLGTGATLLWLRNTPAAPH